MACNSPTTLLNDGMPKLGECLRIWRVLHDIRQKELAHTIGIHQNDLSALERGGKPSAIATIKIMSWLIGEPILEEEPTNPGLWRKPGARTQHLLSTMQRLLEKDEL